MHVNQRAGTLRSRMAASRWPLMQCRLGVALLVIALITGCADVRPLAGRRSAAAVPITPYASHEECALLGAAERLNYEFKSSAPLDFSLYYRDGNAIVTPINRPHTTAAAGIFIAERAQAYCLKWEAGALGVTVSYSLSLLREPAPKESGENE